MGKGKEEERDKGGRGEKGVARGMGTHVSTNISCSSSNLESPASMKLCSMSLPLSPLRSLSSMLSRACL